MHYLKKEAYVRELLSKRLGIPLEKRKVKLKGTNIEWEADFVSNDGKIVGEIKTADYKGKPGTAIPRNLCAPYILLENVVGAEKRILVFTEKNLFNHVMDNKEGQIAKYNGIDIQLILIDNDFE